MKLTTIPKGRKQELARPLKVLVPLIRQDIKDGEEAGVPYFIAAGAKLIEAKPQVPHGEWEVWVRKNFNRDHHTTQVWMRLARNKRAAGGAFKQPRTLSEFVAPGRGSHQPKWHAPVMEAIKRAHPDLERKVVNNRDPNEAAFVAVDEGNIKRRLATELIDIGYRVLATKLHPDKGSKNGDAMQRLNEVRATLKRLATNEW